MHKNAVYIAEAFLVIRGNQDGNKRKHCKNILVMNILKVTRM
jgi:hypothetical protein